MFRLPVPKNYNNAGDHGALQIMLQNQTVDRDALQYLTETASGLRPLAVYCWQSSFVATGEQIYAHSSLYFDQLMILWAIAIEQYLLKDYRNAAGTVRFIRDWLLPLVDRYWPFEPLVPRPPELYRDHYEPVYTYFGALALDDAQQRSACYLRVLDLWQHDAFSTATVASELALLLVEVYRARFDAIDALSTPASQKSLQMYALLEELRARGLSGDGGDEALKNLECEIASAAYRMKRVGLQTESITATAAPAPPSLCRCAPSIANNDEQAFLARVFYTRYTPGLCSRRQESP